MTENSGEKQTDGASNDQSDDGSILSHSGSAWKVLGETTDASGVGVLGHATSATGTTTGVEGVTNSSARGAVGVRGKATGSSGVVYGVEGTTNSTEIESAGVYGESKQTSGWTYGVHGFVSTNDINAAAVRAEARSGAQGLFAESDGYTGAACATGDGGETGVFGINNANSNTSGTGYGVRGVTDSTGDDSAGVYGKPTPTSDVVHGVRGETPSEDTDAAGVKGTATSGNASGVRGVAENSSGFGVKGQAPNGGTGVYADTTGGRAIETSGEAKVNGRLDVETTITDGTADDRTNYPMFVKNQVNDSKNLVLGLETGYTSNPGGLINFITFTSPDGSGGTDFHGAIEGDGTGGVTLNTSGADFAEYLPQADEQEPLEPGDVVGVFEGEITRRTDRASAVLVVSEAPIVAGNSSGPDSENEETVAFTGQVETKVRGPVEDGDVIVPSGNNDGVGRALAPEEWTPEDGPVVGRAWGTTAEEGIDRVTVALGIETGGVVESAIAGNRIEELENEVGALREENESLRDENEQLRERLNALEERVAAVETGGPSLAGADD